MHALHSVSGRVTSVASAGGPNSMCDVAFTEPLTSGQGPTCAACTSPESRPVECEVLLMLGCAMADRTVIHGGQ